MSLVVASLLLWQTDHILYCTVVDILCEHSLRYFWIIKD